MLGREFHWHHIFHKTPFGYVYAIVFLMSVLQTKFTGSRNIQMSKD